MYVCGGEDGIECLRIFEHYNLEKGWFKELKNLNDRRDELSLIMGNDSKLYAIGGYGGSSKYNNDKNYINVK